MALLFQSPITLSTGIVVDNAYGRVAAVDQTTGTAIDAIVDIYVSEASYLSGNRPMDVSFNRTATMAYDRNTMGVDVLDLAHDALIATLAALPSGAIVATKSL